MRIISGKYKGRSFNSKLPTGIRPTQDAMRETIFNILNNYMTFSNTICADICAGAGMLGMEALSRGANKIHFVDKNRKAISYINNNLQEINATTESYKLHTLDATQFINHYIETIAPSQKLDIIFLDPPYNTTIINDVIYLIAELEALAEDGIIVAESAIFTSILIPENYKILTERQFGAAKVTFLKK